MRTRYVVTPRVLDGRSGPISGIQYATFDPSFDQSLDPSLDQSYDPSCDPPWASSCDPSCDPSCDQSCDPSPLFVFREHQSRASLVVQTVSLRQLCSFSHHHHQYVACPEEGKINRVDSFSFVSTVYFSQLTSTGSQPSRNKVVKGHHTQVNQTN